MNPDPLFVIGVLAVIALLVFLLKVKWNFKGPEKPPPQQNSPPQFHTSSAPPRPEKKPVSVSSLTRRERDTARLLAQDMTNDEIARELNLTKRTVEKHVANIVHKFDVRPRSALVEFLRDLDLDSDD